MNKRGIFAVMHLIASETVYPKVHTAIVKKRFVWEREKPRKDLETELSDLAEKTCLDKARELGVANFVIQTAEKGGWIGDRIRGREITFIVNPLSSVYNAANQISFFAFSIAAISNEGNVIAGLVKDLTTGCTFHAMKDGGAWFNGEVLKPSQKSDHEWAIAFAQPGSKRDLRNYLSLWQEERPLRFLGSPVLAICLVALDSLCAYVDLSNPPNTSLPELAAGKIILEEAGGMVTDTSGKPFTNLFNYEKTVNVVAVRDRRTQKVVLDRVRLAMARNS
ncbi:MAG: inositol monophosphatase family protein [Thermoproteota archaeon]